MDSSGSELYHANSAATGDDNTAYDPLDRLTGFERGTLSSSGNNGATLDTVASATDSQSWNLNAVGDQSSVTTNGITTTNSTNAKNQLTANGSNSLTFDNNGNETTDENGQTTSYDAWNHSISVKNSGGTTIASYSYDPHGWRITEAAGGTTTNVYFTDQWQAIEERQGGTVARQNVWGLGYVNQLVERDDNSVSGTLGISGSGLGERLYAEQDANWNVTTLVDTSGTAVQRMTYLPYGTVTFLTGSWAVASDAYAQNVLFQGGRLETATSGYIFGIRDYTPEVGRWLEPDPIDYVDGMNPYQAFDSNPANLGDPSGLASESAPEWTGIHPIGNDLGQLLKLQKDFGATKAKVFKSCDGCLEAKWNLVFLALHETVLDVTDGLLAPGSDFQKARDQIKSLRQSLQGSGVDRFRTLKVGNDILKKIDDAHLPSETLRMLKGVLADVASVDNDLKKVDAGIAVARFIEVASSGSSLESVTAAADAAGALSGFAGLPPGVSDAIGIYFKAFSAAAKFIGKIVGSAEAKQRNLIDWQGANAPSLTGAILGARWAADVVTAHDGHDGTVGNGALAKAKAACPNDEDFN